MRLSSLRLQNFRSCQDVTVNFDNYTCLVGANGAGKSTILTALNILFRNSSGASTSVVELDREDFCSKNIAKPIVITATFVDLTAEEAKDLSAYVRQNRLILSAQAKWNADRGKAEVRQYGSRMVVADFAGYFDAEKGGARAPELKEIYRELRGKYTDLPSATTKGSMEAALRSYEEQHPELCEAVDSEDQFYGWSKGANRLSRFIQWVYIPAVKDATAEQEEARNTALGDLLQRTIRSKVTFDESLTKLHDEVSERYAEIVGKHQDTLRVLSSSLEARLRRWAHPGSKVELQWDVESDKLVSLSPPLARISIGEHNFVGDVARSGHGMQRAFIVSLLQELADTHEDSSPKLLLGFEEPELYQHPPQARHLSNLLEELAESSAQVIVTSHSPYFVSGKGFQSIRMVRKSINDGLARVSQLSHAELAERLASALGQKPEEPSSVMAAIEQILQPSQSEMFFCTVPVFVEGPEDIAFLGTYLQVSGRWREFRKRGCHFIPAIGKTNLSRPLAIALGLGMPAFVIFDGDTDDIGNKRKHERDNGCILNLCGYGEVSAWPDGNFFADNVVMWQSKIRDEVVAEIGSEIWEDAEQEARRDRGLMVGIQKKNPLLITATLETLYANGKQSQILENTCNRLLHYSQQVAPQGSVA